MKFYSIKDFGSDIIGILDHLSMGEDIVITNHGKPAALMMEISEENFDEVVQSVRLAKARTSFNSMRKKASDIGYLDEEEIEAEILSARNED